MTETERTKRNNLLAMIFVGFMLIVTIIICFVSMFKTEVRTVGKIDDEAATMDIEEYNTRLDEGVLYKEDERTPAVDAVIDGQCRQMADEAYQIVNNIRTSNGVDELEWNQNLEACSDIRASEASMYFSHTRPSGSSWWTVNSAIQGGENLAYGYNDAASVVNAWMNSPTHAYNILYNEFNDVSVSVYQAPNGTYYWAQEFGY